MNCKYGFKEARKGYDPQEVDAYIDEQLARMTVMQKQNEILMRKLKDAQEKLSHLSQKEQELRKSIAESKRGAAAMLSDARIRSNALIDSARHECNKIVEELDAEIESKYKTIEDMRGAVASFKSELFKLYSDHIEHIETLSETAENFSYEPDFTALSDAIDSFEESGDAIETPVPLFPEMIMDEPEADADEAVEDPTLSQLEFGFDEPEAEEGESLMPEENENEAEDVLYYDPKESAEEAAEDDISFSISAEAFPEAEEDLFEADNAFIPDEADTSESESESDEAVFQFPREAEEAPEAEADDPQLITEDDIFAFFDENDQILPEAVSEVDEDSDIFAFPEPEEEEEEEEEETETETEAEALPEDDDDMFITDDADHRDKQDLFKFLKDFVNGTEE